MRRYSGRGEHLSMHSAKPKGQLAVEFIVILIISVIILSVIFSLVGKELSEINKNKQSMDARIVVATLAAAAKEVYAQGEGAKKLVYIEIPSEYDPALSYIGNKSIYMRVASSDYVELLDFDVHGTLPQTSGGNYVWIISEGSSVRIGNTYLYVSKSSIPVSMNANSIATEQFYVQNIGNDTINVTISKNWPYSDVTANVDNSSFQLTAGASIIITITFAANNLAYGLYGGNLITTAVTPLGIEDYTTYLSADVAVQGGGGNTTEKNLTIIPHLWNMSIYAGTNTSKQFTICSGQNSSFTTVSFTPSSGAPGIWVGNTSSIGPLPADSCIFKIFTLTVPNDTVTGVYSGSITATGDTSSSDIVSLVFTVLSDIQPPLIQNIIHWPKPAYADREININATANDSATGNSTITGCIISIDGGAFSTMNPVDGAYDTPVEKVNYTIAANTLAVGRHSATIRCNDSFNNTGEANYSFNVFKEIIFLVKDASPGELKESELMWMSFLNTSASQIGFSWDYDIVQADNVTFAPGSPGYVNISNYRTAIIAAYHNGIGLPSVLNSFVDSGRSVALLGDGIDGGKEIGRFASQPMVQYKSNSIYIKNNTHYITSGYFGLTTICLPPYNVKYNAYKKNDYNGTALADAMSRFIPQINRVTLGQAQRYIIWGMGKHCTFTTVGNTIATRTIDFTLNLSTVTDP